MAEKVRINRMKRVVKMLDSAETPIVERKVVAILSYNIGVSMKKIREYIKVLEDMEVVEYRDGELIWKNQPF